MFLLPRHVPHNVNRNKLLRLMTKKKTGWVRFSIFQWINSTFFPNPTECSQNIKPSWPLCPNWLNQVISRETELDIIFFTVAGYSLVTVCDSFAFLLTPSSRDRHVLLIGQSPVRLVYFNSWPAFKLLVVCFSKNKGFKCLPWPIGWLTFKLPRTNTFEFPFQIFPI